MVDNVRLDPSLPATTTEVAFAAATVIVEKLPGGIDVGLAVMLTVAAALGAEVVFEPEPQPTTNAISETNNPKRAEGKDPRSR